jgi:hypothetical protein
LSDPPHVLEVQHMIGESQVQSLIGATAYVPSGDKIGNVYYDDESNQHKCSRHRSRYPPTAAPAGVAQVTNCAHISACSTPRAKSPRSVVGP